MLKFLALNIDLPAVPPSEFRILRSGSNTHANEGGEFFFTEASATSVMSNFGASGRPDIAIDYEHHSYDDTQPKSLAAGWFVPAIRAGDSGPFELWATSVRWTPAATQHLQDREIKYFSPVVWTDEDTAVVTKLGIPALTNNPALKHIAPLVMSANLTTRKPMKLLLNALDLNEDASEASAMSAVSKLKNEAAALKAASDEARTQAEAANKKLQDLEALVSTQRIESMLDKAMAEGRLTPAKRPEMLDLSAKVGVDGLRICLGALPIHALRQAPAQQIPAPEAPASATVIELNAFDAGVAKRMGIDPKAFADYQAARQARRTDRSSKL